MILKPRPLRERLVDTLGRRFADPRSRFSRIHKQRGFIIDPFRFGPGTPTDPNFASVVLLMHGNGTNGATSTVDSSSFARAISAAGTTLPTLSSTQAKFGATSMAFTGSGNSAFTAALSGDFNFGTGDFTVELWVYNTSLSTSPYYIAYRDGSFGWYLTNQSGGTLNWGWMANGGSSGNTGVGSVSTGAWTHVAVSRVSGVLYKAVGGTVTSVAHTVNYGTVTTNPLAVGRDATSGNNVNGWIDDVRITKGVGRYTANFTPPTAPFPDS